MNRNRASDFASKADNSLIRELEEHKHYRLVPWNPVKYPRMRLYSSDAAGLIGLSAKTLRTRHFVEIFVGNRGVGKIKGWATLYGRLKCGHWCGESGDGRAVSICEVMHNDKKFEIQLKGSGVTPYARETNRIPGRVTLRSAIREFLASEAMFHLKIPTTRALSVVEFKNQGCIWEPACAVLTRIAPSFLRFGHLEVFWKKGQLEEMRKMFHHVLRREFPDLINFSEQPGSLKRRLEECEAMVKMFERVAVRQAELLAHWTRVGFVHGNPTSDNCTLGGYTIDYDSFGFCEYSWPSEALLLEDESIQNNLINLCNALLNMAELLVSGYQCCESDSDFTLKQFQNDFCSNLRLIVKMCNTGFESARSAATKRELGKKLGLLNGEKANVLFTEFTGFRGVDYTIFFRRLSLVDLSRFETSNDGAELLLKEVSMQSQNGTIDTIFPTLQHSCLSASNPSLPNQSYALPSAPDALPTKEPVSLIHNELNHESVLGSLREVTIKGAFVSSEQNSKLASVQNEISYLQEAAQPLMQALQAPLSPGLATMLLDWLRQYSEAVLAESRSPAERLREMNEANPKYVLREWMLEYVVDEAVDGNFVPCKEVLEVLRRPYDEQSEAIERRWFRSSNQQS